MKRAFDARDMEEPMLPAACEEITRTRQGDGQELAHPVTAVVSAIAKLRWLIHVRLA